MRAKLPWILFAISLILNLCVVAGYFYFSHDHPRWQESGSGGNAMFAASKLKLDDEQKVKLDAMRQALRKNYQDNLSGVRPLRRDLLKELNQPQPDFTKIDKLIDDMSLLQATAFKASARAIAEFQAALRPDQRTEFRRLIRERAADRMMFGPNRQSDPRNRSGEPGKRAPAAP